MKRVLCIVGGMNAGGAETFLMKVYRCLDKTKYQMDFAVAIEEKGVYDDEIIAMGGKIHHIIPKSKGALKNFKSIKNLVKTEGYECVLRTSQHALSALELLAAKQGGAKTRVFRSSNSNVGSTSSKQLLLHKAFRFMPRHFANVRIAPSTEAAEFMFGAGCVSKNKASLLHNAIDLSVYKYDEESRNKIREEFGLAGKMVVGHIGRFNYQKNHTFLLDVFQLLVKENPEARLLLVGKGELEQEIRQKAERLGIADFIVFAGVRSDIPAILSAMDLFLFPSLYEGMPNTVIEAQATGLPCIVADTITREANITGKVSYVSLSSDASEWCKQIYEKISLPRQDTHEDFIRARYDIESATKDFMRFVWSENK